MDILIVTNPENNHCHVVKCTDDMHFDAKTAFEDLNIHVSEDIIEEIAQQLSIWSQLLIQRALFL